MVEHPSVLSSFLNEDLEGPHVSHHIILHRHRIRIHAVGTSTSFFTFVNPSKLIHQQGRNCWVTQRSSVGSQVQDVGLLTCLRKKAEIGKSVVKNQINVDWCKTNEDKLNLDAEMNSK